MQKHQIHNHQHPSHPAGEPPKEGYKKKMQNRCDDQNTNAGPKKWRHVDWVIQRKYTQAKRNADMSVSNLGRIDNLRIATPAVIQREKSVGQHH